MTTERMHTKESKEIDLIDLIIDLLGHWRGLVIAILIGGVLLGGQSVYSSVKANKAAKIAALAAEEENTKVLSDQEYFAQEKDRIERRIAEKESSLSAKDKTGTIQLLAYLEQLEIQRIYMDRSVLMKVDAYNLPSGTVVLRIVSDQTMSSALENTYKGILSSAEMYDYLKQKLGYGNEITELVTLDSSSSDNQNNNSNLNIEVTTEVNDNTAKEIILVYKFMALTEDDCKALEETFIDYAKSKTLEYQSSLGTHELIVVDSVVSTTYNSLVASMQSRVIQQMATLDNNITSGYDALSDSGKEYYDLLIKQKDMESEIAENIERVEVAAVAIPPITVNKKKLIIGFAGGFFVYAMIICLVYVFSGKVKDSDDFATTFGVNQLGKIYHESGSMRRATRFDKAIYSLKRRGRKKVSLDEASSIVAVNTSLTASKGGYKKLGFITADKEDALIGKISEALKTEGVEGVVLSELLYNRQQMSALKDVDAAVIVAKVGASRYDELSDVIEVLDNQKVKILGGIMA